MRRKAELEVAGEPVFGENHMSWFGGDSNNPTWREYLRDFDPHVRPYLSAARRYITKNNLIGETGAWADDKWFIFDDGKTMGFTWRGWGDFMQAIVGLREGYMAYYM